MSNAVLTMAVTSVRSAEDDRILWKSVKSPAERFEQFQKYLSVSRQSQSNTYQ